MKVRYQYRIYPKPTQIVKLSQLFGCCRRVWNDALAYTKKAHENGEKYPGNSYLQKEFLTQAKKTTERNWLSQVSAIPLQQSLNDLNQAYQNFFNSCKEKRKGKKVRPPKFKKRKSKQTARFTRGGFKLNKHNVYLAKIGKVKIIWSRELPAEPSSATVIKDSANRYFLSFVIEIKPSVKPKTNKAVGIDLGINTFAVLDDGTKINAPKPLKLKLKKLRKLNKSFAKKQKGSNRREKARLKLAKLHAKIKDTRTDFLHKLTTNLVSENQTIVLEDLNVSGMLKNRSLARAISDLGWHSFRTMLEAKSAMYERDFRIISRWEPTSKTCSCCGYKVAKLDLSVRDWKCFNCLTYHDRDVNAAKNILKVAVGHTETQNGHRDCVRLQTEAMISEMSTHQEVKQLLLFDLDGITRL